MEMGVTLAPMMETKIKQAATVDMMVEIAVELEGNEPSLLILH